MGGQDHMPVTSFQVQYYTIEEHYQKKRSFVLMHRFYDSLLNNLLLINKNSLLKADLKKRKKNKYVIGLFGVPFLLWFFPQFSEGINISHLEELSMC